MFREARVIVTGAAGSIGGDLCRALGRMGCAHIGLLDHLDHGLLLLFEEMARAHPRSKCVMMLCDVRDGARLAVCVGSFRPDIVIHCAGLKHVHSGEMHPAEYVLTNLVGASNMMSAAEAARASQFVLISTDKAAAPVSVLGITKRLAELHLRGFVAEKRPPMQLKALRFGNVLDSQGSVSTRFASQIAAGGPLQITHPDMRRYFMSSDEAINFILDVVEQERSDCGDVFVREMGGAKSVLELGRKMIEERSIEIEIEIVGLRPGEKLNELISDDHEYLSPSILPGIYRATPFAKDAAVSTLEVRELEHAARSVGDSRTRQLLVHLLDARLAGPTCSAAD